MRSLRVLALTICLSSSILAQAPTSDAEKAAVVAAVQKFFDTMATGDVEGARTVLMPDGQFFSVREQDGKPVWRARSVAAYLDDLGKRTPDSRERMWSPEVRIRGPIASVWTPYDFWVAGKFSHCGIDAFDLIRTPEGWKIATGVYTVERQGCTPSPLGPLK
jgi:hypothetical protein